MFLLLCRSQLPRECLEDPGTPIMLCYSERKIKTNSSNSKKAKGERNPRIHVQSFSNQQRWLKEMDWSKKRGAENLSSGQFWKIIHGLGGDPLGLDQKQNSDAISCLCTDAGLQIPTWEHLLGTTTWQISRQLGSRSICAKNMGPPAVGRLQQGRGEGKILFCSCESLAI